MANPFNGYGLSGLPPADKPYGRLDDSVLTTEEACEYLRISRPTYLNNFIYTGKINAKKIGRGWKVLKSELDRFLEAGK